MCINFRMQCARSSWHRCDTTRAGRDACSGQAEDAFGDDVALSFVAASGDPRADCVRLAPCTAAMSGRPMPADVSTSGCRPCQRVRARRYVLHRLGEDDLADRLPEPVSLPLGRRNSASLLRTSCHHQTEWAGGSLAEKLLDCGRQIYCCKLVEIENLLAFVWVGKVDHHEVRHEGLEHRSPRRCTLVDAAWNPGHP